jgi:molecular chaperone HscB
VTCGGCGAIQPPDLAEDHFRVLNVANTFALDVGLAEERFRELSRVVHPDRFAKADPRAKRFSTQRTVQLNEAWRTLKDPVRRAEYLLSRAGFEVGAETGASRPGKSGGAREKLPVPPRLLGEILELREELADARGASNHARVQELGRDVRERLTATLARVAAGFARTEAQPESGVNSVLESISHDLIEIRYLRRFLEEVDAHDEAQAEAEHA